MWSTPAPVFSTSLSKCEQLLRAPRKELAALDSDFDLKVPGSRTHSCQGTVCKLFNHAEIYGVPPHRHALSKWIVRSEYLKAPGCPTISGLL